MNTTVLLISCPDKPGIVADVAGWVAMNGGNIVHAEQHTMNAMRLATDARAVALAFAVQSPADAPAPCGICRQRIREFAASLSIPIVAVNLDERLEILRINRYPFDLLLPNSFGPENIGK